MTTVVDTPYGPIPIPVFGKPQQPIDLPGLDQAVEIPLRGLKKTWDEVFGFVRHRAVPFVEQALSVAENAISAAIPVIESYVGDGIKAVSSVFGDAINATAANIGELVDYSLTTAYGLIGGTLAFEAVSAAVYWLTDQVYNHALPAIESEIGGVLSTAEALVYSAVSDITNWVVESVYNPVLAELATVDAQIRTDVWDLVGSWAGTLEDAIAGIDADLLARLGVVAGVAAAVATWVEECGAPMCSTMGPATDLFKFFKALELAGTLSLLMEIANMSEADVEARLRELAGDVQHIVGAFESTFVGGGGTLKDFALSLV